MRQITLIIIYLMFFLSGAAALMYQVVWVRSLSLVFGGSHLAVTTVLSVFMAGLAIGGYAIGRFTDKVKEQLRLYGLLEIGIALFAVLFFFLYRAYPDIYRFLASGKDEAYLYITLIRIAFSVLVLIVPTILMGGTLPVLSRFVSRHPGSLRTHLSFLYGFNTFGAVLGALAAGFFLLRFYSVSTTLGIAIAMNISIGLVSLLLQRRGEAWLYTGDTEDWAPETGSAPVPSGDEQTIPVTESEESIFPFKLVLLGAGVSGFCALGYEVLWTRILVVVTGASVYAFTTMLAAFLTGIALGSAVFGLIPGVFRLRDRGAMRSVFWFGVVQIIIGVLALAVTVMIRDLPENTIRLHNYFRGLGMEPSSVRTWANFTLAFTYMLVPTFFMGVAFPLAGKVHAVYRRKIGAAVGEVLSYNTLGAILGAGISGFLLISLFGIERSLQMLVVVNVGFGLLVCISITGKKTWYWSVAAAMAGFLVFFSLDHNILRLWNRNYFAIFRNNQTEGYVNPELIRAVSEATDILYYGEGLEAIISVTRIGKNEQRMLVNGKIVASSSPKDLQLQFSLGHLPMLLHPRPEKVLVVGLGTGMTLGATSVHPGVRELTLVEIEPKVIDAARTFEDFNHRVLDNPALKVIYNDGRNFLYTTGELFDVITADPIHPWAQGASYLYTREYYRTASSHLSPGGIMCQWLPLYELSDDDVRSVVNTFRTVFPETMLWLTHYDAILIGSRSTIKLDEGNLERRISNPGINADLDQVMMGSAYELLSHFVAGPAGIERYSRGGIINTDDNLYLEFSAPFSVGMPVMENNVRQIVKHRESILPLMITAEDELPGRRQGTDWETMEKAARATDGAHTMFLGNRYRNREFKMLAILLDRDYPEFAPWKFLKTEVARERANTPTVLQRAQFSLTDRGGKEISAAIFATRVRLGEGMSIVMFTDQDNDFKGQLVIDGTGPVDRTPAIVNRIFRNIGNAYQEQARIAAGQGMKYPALKPTMERIDEILASLSEKE
jgi:spermidine synthase